LGWTQEFVGIVVNKIPPILRVGEIPIGLDVALSGDLQIGDSVTVGADRIDYIK